MQRLSRMLKWATLALGLLLLYNALTMVPATAALWRVMFGRMEQGAFGVGVWDGESNEFDFSQLEPGDIVLGGNTGSSWGHWAHTYYSHAGALRVKLPKAVKEQSVAEALFQDRLVRLQTGGLRPGTGRRLLGGA